MRILVTGGAGYIGSQVVKMLGEKSPSGRLRVNSTGEAG